MGSPRLAALLLPLLLLPGLPVSAGADCAYLPCWIACCRCPCRLASPMDARCAGLQWGRSHLLVLKSRMPFKFKLCQRHRMPASPQRKLLGRRSLSEKVHPIPISSPNVSPMGMHDRRTQASVTEVVQSVPRLGLPGHRGPEFTFALLPEERAVRVTVPPGPEVIVRLCHQWVLECEELNSPFDAQMVVPGGRTADLPYEFLLPCLCIEASYLQEDTVRHKKCPFWGQPEAYGLDLWKSVHFTDHSQHNQMVMALTLRCPLKLEATLCQRQDWHAPCRDIPNATAQESEGWYVLEKVDLHPWLCFKFYFENRSHVECPHRSGSLESWNVSMDTHAQQLVLHFSSRMRATFSAAWSHPVLGLDTVMAPVYSVSQASGLGAVTADLIVPFLRPGGCILVWRSDVQFAWKRLLCPDVSHRHLGLLTMAVLGLATLLGAVLVLTCRRLLSGPGPARPVLLLHAADSDAQRRLVGALAELLRSALGDRRHVILDLWEGAHVARVGPLPWLWAARARVTRERGAVLLLWSAAGPGPALARDPSAAPLRALLCAPPRPRLLLAYFGRLCAKGDFPRPLRALPRYCLLRDLPRLLRALGARPSALAASWARLELCRRLEREAARHFCPPRRGPQAGSRSLQRPSNREKPVRLLKTSGGRPSSGAPATLPPGERGARAVPVEPTSLQ